MPLSKRIKVLEVRRARLETELAALGEHLDQLEREGPVAPPNLRQKYDCKFDNFWNACEALLAAKPAAQADLVPKFRTIVVDRADLDVADDLQRLRTQMEALAG